MKLLKSSSLFISALFSTASNAESFTHSITVSREEAKEQAQRQAAKAELLAEANRYTMVIVERTTFQRLKDFFLVKEKIADNARNRASLTISKMETNELYFLSEVQRANFEKSFELEYGVNFEQFNEVQITRKEVDFQLSKIKQRKFSLV